MSPANVTALTDVVGTLGVATDTLGPTRFSLQAFVDSLEVLASAEGGLARLRELVLGLAFQGRLTNSMPSDGDAGRLLERIAVERKKLIASKELVHRDYDDVPLPESPIPGSWEWARLGDIVCDAGQKVPDRPFTYIDVSSIDNVKGRVLADLKIIRPQDAPSRARKLVRQGSVIYATIRPYLLNVAVIEAVPTPSPIVSTAFAVLHPLGEIQSRYLYRYARSPLFIRYVSSQMIGVAYPAINDTKLYSGWVPLPPIAEQKRIVAKMDELMRLLDALEAKHAKKRETQARLRTAALDALTSAEGPEAFETGWKRVAANFGVLFQDVASVVALRASVLTLAALGCLVRAVGPRPLGVPLGEAYEPEFTIPAHWVWSPLGRLCRFIDYRGRTPAKTTHGVPLITAKNVRMGALREEPREYIAESAYDGWMTRGLPQYGDVLFTTEAPLGNVAQLLTRERVALAQRIITLRPVEAVEPAFLKTIIMSPVFQTAIRRHATGTTAMGIKAAKLKLVPFPVPPLAEQKRIVAKVEHLMKLCDDLEAKLLRAETTAAKLVEAIVSEMLGA